MITADDVWELCLPRLRQYYGNHGNVETLASFVNATPKTVSDWLGGQRASGERLLKLWFFLRASGIKSPEFDRLDEYNLYIGELYAFDVVSMEQLCEILNVKQTGTVYETIRGRSPMHPTLLLDDLKPQYDVLLATAKQRVVKVRHLSAVSVANSATEPDGQDGTPSGDQLQPGTTTPSSSVDPSFVVDLSSSLQTSIVQLRFLCSENCSFETRAAVLNLVGDLSELSRLTEKVLGH